MAIETASLGAPFLRDVAVLLLAGVVVPPVMRRLKTSPMVGFLLVGALLGPAGLRVFSDDEGIKPIAELGVIFLLFAIGLELSFERLRALRRLILGLGGAQMLVTTIAVTLIALAWGRTGGAALVFGLCIAFSSTAVAMQLLSERHETAAAHGRSAFAVLLLQDLAVAPVLVLLGVLAHGAAGPFELSIAVGGAMARALAAIALIIIIGRFVLRRLCRLIAEDGGPELRVGFAALMILATAWLTYAAGLSAPLGAFLAGLLIAETPLRAQVEADLAPFRGLLLGVFFIGVGLSLSPTTFLTAPGFVLVAVLGLAMLKASIMFFTAILFGRPPAEAARVSGLLAGSGEFGFVVAAAAGLTGLMDPSSAQFVALVIALSMVATPLFDLAGRRLAERLEREAEGDSGRAPTPISLPGEERVIIAGFGRVGRIVAKVLDSQSAPWIAVERRPAAVEAGVILGDAARAGFLNRVGLASASALVVTVEDPAVAERIVAAARARRPDLHIIVRACDEAARERLAVHGARTVSAESFAPGPQLASCALDALGAPAQTIKALIEDAGLEERSAPLANPEENHVKS